MNDDKIRNEEDIKNFLLRQKENESKVKKFTDKIKKISDIEKKQRKDLKEKSGLKQM
jgi:hypothetical protein